VLIQTHGAQSVWVSFQADDGGAQTTPTTDASVRAQTLPVLGLQPSTHYSLQALASDGDGGLASSPVMDFTTDVLPSTLSNYAFEAATTGTILPGYVMVSKLLAGGNVNQDAVIVDRSGQVVWYRSGGLLDGDFQKQPDGSYTLSSGAVSQVPFAYASVYRQFDSLGDVTRSWTVPNGGANLHELLLQPNGDALTFTVTTRTYDMSAYDGGSATASLTGNILVRVMPDGGTDFASDFFDDFDPTDIVAAVNHAGAAVDAIHANSIFVASDGNYLESARHLSQVRKIDAQTGAVIWKLGGLRSDFTFSNDPLGGFSMQHFAREVAPDDILLFDDGDEHTPAQSRAVEYKLHFDSNGAPTDAELVWSYTPPPDASGNPIYGLAMGSAQRLPDGHTLIDYGTFTRVDEVDAQGNLVWQLTDPNPGLGIYRAFFIDSLY